MEGYRYNGGLLPDIILVDPMLLPSGNPFKCHEEVSFLQPMIPPKRSDISPTCLCGNKCSEDLDAFTFFFKQQQPPFFYNNPLEWTTSVRRPSGLLKFYVCMVITYGRVWIDLVRWPILLVVS